MVVAAAQGWQGAGGQFGVVLPLSSESCWLAESFPNKGRPCAHCSLHSSNLVLKCFMGSRGEGVGVCIGR